MSLVNVSVMKATLAYSATAVQMATMGFLTAEVSQIRVSVDKTSIHSASFNRCYISYPVFFHVHVSSCYDETTTMTILNIRRNVDSEKNPSPRWDLNPRPSVI